MADDERLQVTNRRLARKRRQIKEIEGRARDLAEGLERRTEELERAERELREVTGELERIRASASFRVARGLTMRLHRWFPSGTARGWLLSGARRSVYRLLGRSPGGRRAAPPSAIREGLTEGEPTDWTQPERTEERYRTWIDRYEPGRSALERQREAASSLSDRPLISLVIPAWNPPVELLRETVRSVQAQTYEHWEICIADGASDDQVRDTLKDLQRSEPRIRVRHLDRNLGIAGNTNEALTMARGAYVAFLDQTDTLPPFALYEVAVALNRDPGLDLLYSDWDLLSEDGRVRFNPFFTPEWSPDLLLSTNFMAHLLVARRDVVNEAGGLRPEMDGAQDWDLLLRVTERTDRIGRVTGVLYHWRVGAGSAALSLESKPEAEERQRRAVEEHLTRRGLAARVTRDGGGSIRIKWEVTGDAKVSIVIPTRHNRQLLTRCLEAIARSGYPNREILVIETAGWSEDREGWYERLAARFPVKVLWWNQPFNYSAVNNWAAGQATGEILLFLNDDTEPLTDDWLAELVGWVKRDKVGVVGAHMVDANGRLQHGGVVIGLTGFAEHLFRGLAPGEWSLLGSTMWYRNLTAVTGACLAIRRELFEAIGGWDERFSLCGSDVELCLRVRRAGFRVVVTPFARIRHLEAATRGPEVPEEDYFLSFWHYQKYVFGGDPYFNPNLSSLDTVPRLKVEGESPLPVISDVIGRDVTSGPAEDEGEHAAAMAEVCRIDPEDIKRTRATHASISGRREVTTVNWFIPDFENPFYGGIHTVFRFADHFQRVYGVKNRFVSMGFYPEEHIRSGLRVSFPDLTDSEIFVAPSGPDDLLADVPDADASVATLWVTAYPLGRYKSSGRKFYFVQDFEPMFYPAGAQHALAEETYRMGLIGIANTPPLKTIFESYGGRAVAFTPCVDADLFHANRPFRGPGEPHTVFMYGRPGHPRNCYELAVAALERLKGAMKERVRIVAAGSWAEGGSAAPTWLNRLGWLDYEETPDLYRQCDAGLVLSVSKHPTYIPLQLMASGTLVVANRNPANAWLLRDGENCIVADPTAGGLADALERGLRDDGLRARLTARARDDIEQHHSEWGAEIDRVYRFMSDPGAT